jgi:hypothetical protein
MNEKLRTYTRVHVPFVASPITGPELTERALTSSNWCWWARDDGRIVTREFLTKSWTVLAIENEEG